jgi:hypothetical protein
VSHDVTFATRDLGRADVEFNVKKDDAKLGTLRVSKGALVWFPKDHTYGYKVSWTDLDKFMTEQGDKAEKR